MTATEATAAPPFAQLYPLAAFEAIADAAWWRSDDFGHGQDVDQDARIAAREALNSAKGRDTRIAAHAAEHGIGYVQTTNTSVAVHRHPRIGTLMVTQRWWKNPEGDEMPEDKLGIAIVKGWKGIAAFNCNMWRVMAMDRSIAIARMEAGGNADADKTLADYLASNDAYAGNVAGNAVERGRWRIHGGDDFSKRVDRKRFGIPSHVHVWCLLERVGEAAA